MAIKYWIGSLPLFLFLAGCATYLNGSINAIPDPGYSFDKSIPILVTVVDNMNNSLQSRYFVPRVASWLRTRGFRYVYTDNDKTLAKEPFKIVVFVSVDTKTSSFTYNSPVYGRVQTSSTTNCNSYDYGYNGTINCTTVPHTRREIVGYSDKIGYTIGHFFNLGWFDVPTKRQVFSVVTSTFNNKCSEGKIYDFLAEQTFSRVSLTQIVKQDFNVKMPEGYRCNQ